MRNKINFIPVCFIAALSILTVGNAQLYNTGQMFVDSAVTLYAKDTIRNNSGANILNKGILAVGGALVNNASVNGEGKVMLSGNVPQNVLGNGNISNLDINNVSATIVTGNMQHISGTLTLTNGALNANGGLTLLSTDSNTARVAPVVSGIITGNVFVERYIPARRAWRLMTAPVSNAATIRTAWQNNGNFIAGRGTFITGPGGNNGLDNGTNFSLKTYNQLTQQLENVTNTNVSLSATSIGADNVGYFLFVRGDRNPANLTPPNTNSTTLTSSGNLQTGSQSFAASIIPGNFTLVGNPFASPVNFDAVTRSNIVKRFYAWDPALNVVGGYVLLDDVDEDGTYSITPLSSQTKIIQSSQAIFVQTMNLGPASITFEETSKSTLVNHSGFRINNGTTEVLRANLYLKNANGSLILADGILAEYNNIFSPLVDIQDGAKMNNINENLAINRDGKSLSIERRPLVDINDTAFLKLWNTTIRSYQLEFLPANFASVVSAWLQDSYLNTSTPLSMTGSTLYDFQITNNNSSSDVNRFRIVFKTTGTLPVSFTGIKAYELNSGIQVEWNNAAETNIRHYELEKSPDGLEFTKLAHIAAKSNNNSAVKYDYFDAQPIKGNNYYRIKAIKKTSEIFYSKTVNVKTGSKKESIVIYPNPVKEKVFNVQLNNQPKGKYTIQLSNASGQVLFTKVISHLGGSYIETIELTSEISKGIYQLKINNGEIMNIQKIIFD